MSMSEEDKNVKLPDYRSHLGDGFYVDFDGYQIIVRINDHRNPIVAAIKPQVMLALVHYAISVGVISKEVLANV